MTASYTTSRDTTRDLLLSRRLAPVAGLILTAILLCVRFDPLPAQPGQTVDAVQFAVPGVMPNFNDIYFGQLQLTDACGTLVNITQLRAIPLGAAIRVLALRRPLKPPVQALGLSLDDTPAILLHASPRLALPFQSWHPPDEFYGPR